MIRVSKYSFADNDPLSKLHVHHIPSQYNGDLSRHSKASLGSKLQLSMKSGVQMEFRVSQTRMKHTILRMLKAMTRCYLHEKDFCLTLDAPNYTEFRGAPTLRRRSFVFYVQLHKCSLYPQYIPKSVQQTILLFHTPIGIQKALPTTPFLVNPIISAMKHIQQS